EVELSQLVKERRMLRHNENTICTLERLRKELLRTRKNGYAVDDEEEEIGIRCVGVPVIGGSGEVAAAISVSGTVLQIRPEDVPRLGNLLQGSAHDMSQRLAASSHANLR